MPTVFIEIQIKNGTKIHSTTQTDILLTELTHQPYFVLKIINTVFVFCR